MISLLENPSRFLDVSDYSFVGDDVERNPEIAYIFGYGSYQVCIRRNRRKEYETAFRGRLIDSRGLDAWHTWHSSPTLFQEKPYFLSLVKEFCRENESIWLKEESDAVPF